MYGRLDEQATGGDAILSLVEEYRTHTLVDEWRKMLMRREKVVNIMLKKWALSLNIFAQSKLMEVLSSTV